MKNASLRAELFRYAKEKYHTEPEYPWQRFPDYAVFRHADNRKWYGLVMKIPRSKLGLRGEGQVDILNVKLGDPLLTDLMLQQKGFFPGYHISRGSWVSILLDGTVEAAEVCRMLDISFGVTASKSARQRERAPKEWLIPANPRYYDVVRAFAETEEISWKHGAGIKAGDTVFMYVAAPVSAVLFKCAVTETDIPYRGRSREVKIKSLMKIRLLKRYPPERFTFEELKRAYGIYAVRGPRGVPHKLSRDLNEE